MSATFDDSEPYDLNIWVESTKSLKAFEQSLAAVTAPLAIRDHKFALGEIDCAVHVVGDGAAAELSRHSRRSLLVPYRCSDYALELLGAF